MNVLLTGSSRGIGNSIKIELESKGYTIISPSRSELDLANYDSVNKYEPPCEIDVLINNAGINYLSDITSITIDKVSEMMQVNVISPMFLINKVSKSMISRKYGKILNISSIFGSRSKEKRVMYSTTKSAIEGMTRGVAMDLSKYNIMVNSVSPGYVDTSLTKQNNTEQELEIIKSKIPMKMLAEPKDIANVVMFLISKENTYVTGQNIFVDGGLSIC
jgi:3-oxoacyl-[acyl-carrier protein] reductase